MKSFKQQINDAAFDSYDPGEGYNGNTYSDRYDPDFADGGGAQGVVARREARPGRKMQLNVTITNSALITLKTELFSAFCSWAHVYKPEYVSGAYLMIPLYTYEGLQALIAAPTGGATVGYNSAGNLEVRAGAGAAKLIVGCADYPYNSLVESTKVLPFEVSFFRYTVSTDSQIDNNIYNFRKTFAGAIESNTISPRSYFKPEQQQNKTIDVLASFTIDGQAGLYLDVLAGESPRFAFFISRWGKPDL